MLPLKTRGGTRLTIQWQQESKTTCPLQPGVTNQGAILCRKNASSMALSAAPLQAYFAPRPKNKAARWITLQWPSAFCGSTPTTYRRNFNILTTLAKGAKSSMTTAPLMSTTQILCALPPATWAITCADRFMGNRHPGALHQHSCCPGELPPGLSLDAMILNVSAVNEGGLIGCASRPCTKTWTERE